MPGEVAPLSNLYELIEEIDTALLVTRGPDGSLVSRPMSTQGRAAGADLWFVASSDSDRLDELARDQRVNVTFFREGAREWISIAGTAALSSDPSKIRELWRPDWKMLFAADDLPDDPRAGTPDDPRIVLVGVRATSARLTTADRPRPVVLFELVKGVVTGGRPPVLNRRRSSADRRRADSTSGYARGR